MKTVILGASRGPGARLFNRLLGEGKQVLGISRHPQTQAQTLAMDAADSSALGEVISAEDTLIHCSRPELLTGYLQTAPRLARLVALGSTRLYSRYPDDKQQRVKKMQEAVQASAIPHWAILHPTLIYGASGLNNVERILGFARFSPVIPLPLAGRSQIQPVHVDDLCDAVLACLSLNEPTYTAVIAGQDALAYKDFVEMTARAAGHRCRVVSLPFWTMSLLGGASRLLPFVPSINAEELTRLGEDKVFDIASPARVLGYSPRQFAEGIAEVYGRQRQ